MKALFIFILYILLSLTSNGDKTVSNDIPAFSSNNSTLYTKEYIFEKTGRTKMSEREFSFNNITSHNYWYAGKKESYYDYLDFYLFDTAEDAEKSFKKMCNNWIDTIYEQTNCSIEGDQCVCDATIRRYIYLKNNLIITTELEVYSEWATEYDPNPTLTPEKDAAAEKYFSEKEKKKTELKKLAAEF